MYNHRRIYQYNEDNFSSKFFSVSDPYHFDLDPDPDPR